MIQWLTQLFASFKTPHPARVERRRASCQYAETFHKTRSVVGSVVVLVTGAGLVWAANNITVIQDKVGRDVNNPGALIAPARNTPPAALALAKTSRNVTLVVYRGGDR